MLEKPAIHDETIIACLRENYGLSVAGVEFLPIGYDANAGVYRVSTADETDYFLKVKKGGIDLPGVSVPRYLKDMGINEVVAPLLTTSGTLWQAAGDFALILYPFIEGGNGMDIGLSDDQWHTLGRALKRIHTTSLSPDILLQVARETFSSSGRLFVRNMQKTLAETHYENPHEQALATYWNENHELITHMLDRAETLGMVLKNRPSDDWCLCHSDIHAANILLSKDGLYIVDWDQPILAPKERDLMFIGGACVGQVSDAEEEFFYRGYGETDMDYVALAYYRYERIIQDFLEFGKQVFLTPDVSDRQKENDTRIAMSQFLPGGVLDMAHKADAKLTSSLSDKNQ